MSDLCEATRNVSLCCLLVGSVHCLKGRETKRIVGGLVHVLPQQISALKSATFIVKFTTFRCCFFVKQHWKQQGNLVVFPGNRIMGEFCYLIDAFMDGSSIHTYSDKKWGTYFII